MDATQCSLLCVGIAFLVHATESADLISHEDFTHRIVLEDNKYELYWSYDEDYMTFLIYCTSRGFISFGFSPDGDWPGTDLIIGGVQDDGDEYLKDYHVRRRSRMPIEDDEEDWDLMEARENQTHTAIMFRREFETCDGEDVIITNGTMRIIWGYGDTDTISFPGMIRGNSSVFLKAVQTNKPIVPSDAIRWDFRATRVAIKANTASTSRCEAFEVPFIRKKHHGILFEPLIQAGHEAMIYHIALYECRPPRQTSPPIVRNMKGECAAVLAQVPYCTSVVYAWGSGAGPFYLPENVGYPLGDDDSPEFFMLELHYQNPFFLQGITDSSGVRLTLTPTTRQFDAGVMKVGHAIGRSHIIPPRTDNFTTFGFCPGRCLSQAMRQQEDGIKVFGNLLQAHSIAKSVRLRHIRKGIELPVIDGDENYDDTLQESRQLPQEVTILPGDDLIVDCMYNSTKRASITWGGTGAQEEMCMSIMYYYPRIKLSQCESIPLVGDLFPIISGKTTSLTSWEYDLSQVFWTKEISKRFEKMAQKAQRAIVCERADLKYAMAHEIQWKPISVNFPQPWPLRRCSGAERQVAHLTPLLTLVAMIIFLTV